MLGAVAIQSIANRAQGWELEWRRFREIVFQRAEAEFASLKIPELERDELLSALRDALDRNAADGTLWLGGTPETEAAAVDQLVCPDRLREFVAIESIRLLKPDWEAHFCQLWPRVAARVLAAAKRMSIFPDEADRDDFVSWMLSSYYLPRARSGQLLRGYTRVGDDVTAYLAHEVFVRKRAVTFLKQNGWAPRDQNDRVTTQVDLTRPPSSDERGGKLLDLLGRTDLEILYDPNRPRKEEVVAGVQLYPHIAWSAASQRRLRDEMDASLVASERSTDASLKTAHDAASEEYLRRIDALAASISADHTRMTLASIRRQKAAIAALRVKMLLRPLDSSCLAELMRDVTEVYARKLISRYMTALPRLLPQVREVLAASDGGTSTHLHESGRSAEADRPGEE